MKILYVCSDLGIPVLGRKGAAVHVRALVGAFGQQGHDVVLCAPILNKSPWEQPARLEGSVLHMPPSDEAKDAALTLKMFNESLGGVANSLPGEVRRILYNQELEKRLVRKFDSHAPDFIYERASLYGTAGAATAEALDRPLVVELNAPLSTEQAAYRGTGIARLAAEAERSTLTRADAVVVVSAALRDYASSLGVPTDDVHVMPNGVDTKLFHPAEDRLATRAKWRLGDGPVVGFVGGLRPWHGIEALPDLLGRLAQSCPGVRLVVVGDGPLGDDLQARLDARGLGDRAIITGLLPHEEVPELIRAFDVAVAPYPKLEHAFYFSPLKLFEYMACGVPVVAPQLGQIEEIIRDGKTGLLYPAGDNEAMAAACTKLLGNQSSRRELGEEGARLVRSRYTWDNNATRVGELVGELARKRGSG